MEKNLWKKFLKKNVKKLWKFFKDGMEDIMNSDMDEKEKLLAILRKIRKEHPDATADELESLANAEMLRK